MDDALSKLEADGLIRQVDGRARTTRRFQGAMGRAALRLGRLGHDGADLRVPIALALVDLYGPDTPSDELAAYVDALLPIEAFELAPRH